MGKIQYLIHKCILNFFKKIIVIILVKNTEIDNMQIHQKYGYNINIKIFESNNMIYFGIILCILYLYLF